MTRPPLSQAASALPRLNGADADGGGKCRSAGGLVKDALFEEADGREAQGADEEDRHGGGDLLVRGQGEQGQDEGHGAERGEQHGHQGPVAFPRLGCR